MFWFDPEAARPVYRQALEHGPRSPRNREEVAIATGTHDPDARPTSCSRRRGSGDRQAGSGGRAARTATERVVAPPSPSTWSTGSALATRSVARCAPVCSPAWTCDGDPAGQRGGAIVACARVFVGHALSREIDELLR